MQNRFFRQILNLFIIVFATIGASSCSSDDPGPDPDVSRKKTLLVYAVASNNLYGNLGGTTPDPDSDKGEILTAAKNIDLTRYSILLYQVIPGESLPVLLEVVKNNDGSCSYQEVKSYDKSVYSTDPQRITQVINDARTLRPADSYGLILWSHGLGWSPFFSKRDEHTKSSAGITQASLPQAYSFGMDTNNGYTDKIDIDELAEAIPSGMFEFIWFDCCMMSGIELIYELRGKCDYFGAYPTEVYNPGMPYHLCLPYMMKEKADLRGCAEKFFSYYSKSRGTVAVVDMSVIEEVADYCRRAYDGATAPSTSGLLYYSGNQSVAYPFYDFGQYTKLMAKTSQTAPSEDEFNQIMDRFVIYKAATDREFTGRPIPAEDYSGISCHRYEETQSDAAADYYRTLSWFKRVYGE